MGRPEGVVRRRVKVSGMVQGVWYRDTCRREARALGVSGWVRNRPDGTVEALVQGQAAAVDRLIEWMRLGPPRARVADVAVTRDQTDELAPDPFEAV